VTKALSWLWARTWAKWLLAILVGGTLLYFWNLKVTDPYGYHHLVHRIRIGGLTIAGAVALFFAIWASFSPRVPDDKAGIQIVGVPFFDVMNAGQVITTSRWHQGPYAHPLSPGTTVMFPLIRLWMWLAWYRIEYRDLLDIDPRAVAVLFSNIDGPPSAGHIMYWGNGPEEYSGAVLIAGRPTEARSRGILQCVLPPGKYATSVDNEKHLGAFKIIIVDTSKNTVHLDDHPIAKENRSHHKFEPMLLKTKNGFPFRAKIEIVFQVKDLVKVTSLHFGVVNLPGPVLIVARNGSLEDYVRDALVPITTAVINAEAVDIEIDEYLDKMKGVQQRLQEKLEAAAHAALPSGQLEPEIIFHQVSLVFDAKGFPQTEEYIKTRTDKARQEALRNLQEAELETNNKFTIPLRQAEAKAKFAEVEILAQLRRAAAASTAEANKTELESIANVIAEKGISGLGQLAMIAYPLLRERFINEGEALRDDAEIRREEADTEHEKVVRADAPRNRRRRGHQHEGSNAPSGSVPTATAEGIEDREEEG